MTTQASQTVYPIRKTVTVPLPQAQAFKVFTEDFSRWWPHSGYHIGQADIDTLVLEPRTGGRWYERGVDGSECDWGRVLTWEPPSRLVLAWQISPEWTFDPGLDTEVEVRFTPLDSGETRVELEHRGLEAYGASSTQMRGIFDSDGGWSTLLGRYAELAAASR